MLADVSEEEWYPVLEVRTCDEIPEWVDPRYRIEIPDDIIRRWEAGFAAFNAIQKEMAVHHARQIALVRQVQASEGQ